MLRFNIDPGTQSRLDACKEAYVRALPYRYTDKDKYVGILNEFYSNEAARRVELYQRVSSSTQNIKTVLMYISKRENIIPFMVDWCWTYDPRLSNIGLPTSLPFIPWPQQIEFLEWAYEKYLNQKRSIIEKSRDQGATWLFCLFFIFEWRWTYGFAGGIGSSKLANVDNRDDPDAIFEKIRNLLKLLPRWWMPSEFDWRKHDKIGNLYNPNMKSNLAGQGGKNIGRGGRRSAYLVDESAAVETPMDADSSLSQVTDCQFDLSTPRGMNHFGRKRHSGKLPVFTFHWKNDPRKDQEWYQHQVDDLDPVIVAQEIDINYKASVEGLFIEPKWVEAAVDLDLPSTGPRSAGLDVAAGGPNKSALALKLGCKIHVEPFSIDNGVDLTHMSIEMCNRSGVEYLNYDEIGVGYAVESVVNRTEMIMDFNHYGLNAGDSPSDQYYPEYKKTGKEVFANARSEWWYITRQYFLRTWEYVNKIRDHKPENLITIPNNRTLIDQLCSPLKMYTETGKMKCESKQFMLKRGIVSPDEGDAVVLACQKRAGGVKHVMGNMDFLGSASEKVKIDWSQPTYKTRHYAAVCIEKNLRINAMYAVWDEEVEKLYIYGEYLSEHPDPEELVRNMACDMELDRMRLTKILGNDVMFKDYRRSLQKEINGQFKQQLGRFQNIKLKEARRYDPMGSTATLMQLIKTKSIQIDINCKNIKNQFYTWKLELNNYEHTGMRECILLIISELSVYLPFKKVLMKKPKYSEKFYSPEGDAVQSPMDI